MTDYIRRLVSGNKARFKDGKLNLELDLVYITDQVIVMGYPAIGLEGLYRNRREDAKKFLEHRHGNNFWVFNFCPVKENAYPASVFDGRVSRYPFPDHHAPPLALLPLVSREINAWLSESRDRVVALHCKAGKGRSGTLACTYLLSLDVSPSAPRLERSYSAKEWARVRADEWMEVMPDDNDTSQGEDKKDILHSLIDDDRSQVEENGKNKNGHEIHESHSENSAALAPSSPTHDRTELGTMKILPTSLKDVLDLHTSRRMQSPSPSSKGKQGVSIPSQRRWLYYWSLLLANQGPLDFWPISTPSTRDAPSPKVRLSQIKLRMRELSGLKLQLIKAASMVMDRAGYGRKGYEKGHVWASLARYDDEMVEGLEKFERLTRHESGNIGKRNTESGHIGDEKLEEFFADGTWDNQKMVHSFARMGPVGELSVQKGESSDAEKTVTYILQPLSRASWVKIRNEIPREQPNGLVDNSVPSEANSMYDATQVSHEDGIILEANREVRIKLYMGQVFMGWLWIIPAFHIPRASPQDNSITRLLFTRKDIDFPLGIGSSLVDVEVTLEWCSELEASQLVDSVASDASKEASEPAEMASDIPAIATRSVEAKQAAGD
ncbi:hypothetical protein SERLA73DRAFT_83635 [Serpula lacrymans var. lacrymans S7.3]|uniref:phosphatidylinositol-3,4,5-trisphosphate 3-phosphatase n=1 Tax=Serpula lacrymans var. lacrymans (strain S7.3) TaxID=936435 RepID=F8PKM4_SERL3|nr:hypothetical protein SERLA73DRAFT_83635 [Serpula lacrymans var. lacrymans S7.3]